MRQERRIRRHYDDDRASVAIEIGESIAGGIFRLRDHRQVSDLLSYGHARDTKLTSRSIISLHQHSDGITARSLIQLSRRCADAAFEAMANHPRAAADITFRHRPRHRIVERIEDMILFD